MIKIGDRIFVPMKVAANHVGYSTDWIKKCSARYRFPKKRYYNGRVGFWLDELDRWMLRRVRNSAAA